MKKLVFLLFFMTVYSNYGHTKKAPAQLNLRQLSNQPTLQGLMGAMLLEKKTKKQDVQSLLDYAQKNNIPINKPINAKVVNNSLLINGDKLTIDFNKKSFKINNHSFSFAKNMPLIQRVQEIHNKLKQQATAFNHLSFISNAYAETDAEVAKNVSQHVAQAGATALIAGWIIDGVTAGAGRAAFWGTTTKILIRGGAITAVGGAIVGALIPTPAHAAEYPYVSNATCDSKGLMVESNFGIQTYTLKNNVVHLKVENGPNPGEADLPKENQAQFKEMLTECAKNPIPSNQLVDSLNTAIGKNMIPTESPQPSHSHQ